MPDSGYCGLKQVTVDKISDFYYSTFTRYAHAPANSGTYEYSTKTAYTYWPHTYIYNLSLDNSLAVDVSRFKKVYANVSLQGSEYYSDDESTSEIADIWTNHSLNSISINAPDNKRRYIFAEIMTSTTDYLNYKIYFGMDSDGYNYFKKWQQYNSDGEQLSLTITFFYN